MAEQAAEFPRCHPAVWVGLVVDPQGHDSRRRDDRLANAGNGGGFGHFHPSGGDPHHEVHRPRDMVGPGLRACHPEHEAAVPVRVKCVLPEPEKVQIRRGLGPEPRERVERRHAGVGLLPRHNLLPAKTGTGGTAGDDREDRAGPVPGQGARTGDRAHQRDQTHGPVQGRGSPSPPSQARKPSQASGTGQSGHRQSATAVRTSARVGRWNPDLQRSDGERITGAGDSARVR